MKRKISLLLLLLTTSVSYAQSLNDCSICAIKVINESQLIDLSIDEVRLLTNDLFARKGYHFENSRFQDYFRLKDWYTDKNNNKAIVFNNIEKQNIKILQDKTKQLKNDEQNILKQLNEFKNLVVSNNKSELKSKFGFTYEVQNEKEESNLLKSVFSKINLDDINYYKSVGINNVTVDNGFVKILYEIAIDKKEVNLTYNFMTHSEIIKDFDVFTDYHSENEFMYNWQFKFINNQLKFIRLAVAG